MNTANVRKPYLRLLPVQAAAIMAGAVNSLTGHRNDRALPGTGRGGGHWIFLSRPDWPAITARAS